MGQGEPIREYKMQGSEYKNEMHMFTQHTHTHTYIIYIYIYTHTPHTSGMIEHKW